ncbi:protein SCARECROW-like [Andrographis paniculata]|uniref:protein SCARECROW-like n=1 Tax=Andrographis paniculata TaxID=175694 RepID=UPI0021E86B4D|nr:protein SCARECROW-like [Andrographis paniculata]
MSFPLIKITLEFLTASLNTHFSPLFSLPLCLENFSVMLNAGLELARPDCSATELSQWVELVTKQLVKDSPEAEIELSFDHEALDEFRPRKIARKSPGVCDEPVEAGLDLLTILLECAVAISVDNLGEAYRMLLELTQMASPYGASCAERVVAYFARAMSSRVINSWLGACSPLIDVKAAHGAFHVYNNVTPFVKFAHFTSNQAILEAVHTQNTVHIVDLDIMQGLQWPALFHILATRAAGPPRIRLTGIGTSPELLSETGKNLSGFARRLGMHLEFHAINGKFSDVPDVSALQIRQGEAVAVHWLQHSLYDATGPDWKTMRLLRRLRPRVMTLVEPEIGHGGSFLDRFVSSLHYYSTVFDSLGAVLPPDDSGRHQVEHGLLHREINNVLAVGGPARSGEERFRHWRSELLRNGFAQVAMSRNSTAQAQLILNMFPLGNGYTLGQGDGTLRLGWKGTGLYTASAWTAPEPAPATVLDLNPLIG